MNKKTKLRDYIIKYFLITIVSVSLVESIISYALNQWIFPIMKLYQSDGVYKENLSFGEIIAFLFLLAVNSVLNMITRFIPGTMKGIFTSLANQSEKNVLNNYSALGNKLIWSQQSYSSMIMYIFFLAVIVLVYLLPYIIGIYVFSKTVIKKVEELERQQEKEREEFSRKRNLLLSDIAHDLRTPMPTISGYAKAINDGMIEEEKQREYLDIIQNKAKRMNDLIELLFEYVKIDSHGYTLQKEKTDIIELVRENAALMYNEIEEAGMEFVIDIPEEEMIVELDRLQISRVISNLLVNAIKHNETYTLVKISVKKYPGILVIDIADNGKPIPEEIQDNIFDPFARGDKSRNSKGGTGLGLSIAKKIINMHGWEIYLNTNYPEYTKSFEIKIPILE